MKYFKKLKLYKNSTKTNVVDIENMTAYSYDHWQYLKKQKGWVFFNNSRYSNSTSKHQRECYALLNNKPDVILTRTKTGLSNLSEALSDEIEQIKKEIIELNELIKKPGTRKAKNLERIKQVDHLGLRVNELLTIKKAVEK